jgi:cell division protein FtsW
MRHRFATDRWLFLSTVALCLVGAVMVFSASAVTAREQYGNAYFFLLRQVLWLLFGLAAMLALMNLDYRRLRRPALIFTALAVILVLLASVFLLDKSHATHRWIRIGPLGFQPSELAKLGVILYLSWFLSLRMAQGPQVINDWRRTLVPALAPVLLIATLVLLEPDLGTAVEVFLIALAMLFVAGLSLRWVLGPALAVLPLVVGMIVFVPWRFHRLMSFRHPESDPQRAGFQLLQSLIAVGSGGFSGVGLMESRQKLFYLPEAHTDFIFAVLSEELGFVGGVLVLGLFAIYAWRGLSAALASIDPFGRLLALGITTMVISQALINLGVVLGLMPTKGLPLPFISYGGSSLLVMLLATGVLSSISQQAE